MIRKHYKITIKETEWTNPLKPNTVVLLTVKD